MGLVIRMRDSLAGLICPCEEEPFDRREISAPHISPVPNADVYRPRRMTVALLCRCSVVSFDFRSIINIRICRSLLSRINVQFGRKFSLSFDSSLVVGMDGTALFIFSTFLVIK